MFLYCLIHRNLIITAEKKIPSTLRKHAVPPHICQILSDMFLELPMEVGMVNQTMLTAIREIVRVCFRKSSVYQEEEEETTINTTSPQ